MQKRSRASGDFVAKAASCTLAAGVKVGVFFVTRRSGAKAVGADKADNSDAISTIEDIEACMQEANRPMKLALILALHLGRREGDLIRISWGDYDGERIGVSNRKDGRKIRFKAGAQAGCARR